MAKKSDIDWLLYERTARDEGYGLICGVDEAGRGPLAGPVFAAAVILPPDTVIDGVNDSKKLSEKRREALFDIIIEKAMYCSVSAASETEIDTINIRMATHLAMRRAVDSLDETPDLVIVDGNDLPADLPCDGRTLVKGDSLCESIACASILAKVSRDRYMRLMADIYPEYNFAKHKGYGTPEHIAALREHGMCPLHRRSFLTKIEGIPR